MHLCPVPLGHLPVITRNLLFVVLADETASNNAYEYSVWRSEYQRTRGKWVPKDPEPKMPQCNMIRGTIYYYVHHIPFTWPIIVDHLSFD